MGSNSRRIVFGGLLAGVAIIVVNVIAQLTVGDRARSDMNAWLPGSADRMSLGAGALAAGIMFKLTIGVLIVWLSAALRPRFGPGPRPALYASMLVWVLGAIFFSDYPMMGMISICAYVIAELFQLVAFLLAAWIGARVSRN